MTRVRRRIPPGSGAPGRPDDPDRPRDTGGSAAREHAVRAVARPLPGAMP